MARRIVPPPANIPGGDFYRNLDNRGNPQQAAADHNYSRNVHVARCLIYLELMQSAGIDFGKKKVVCEPWEEPAPAPGVTVGKAKVQSYRAQKYGQHLGLPSGREEMAHFVPGQIRIGGRNPWEYLHDHETMLEVQWVFAFGEHLPANYNKADSAAEKAGLRAAFRDVCEAAISGSKTTDRAGRIYDTLWLPQARAAVQQAILDKQSKPRPVPLRYGDPGGMHFHEIANLDEVEAASDYQHNIEETIAILQIYLADMVRHPHVLNGTSPDRLILIRAFRP